MEKEDQLIKDLIKEGILKSAPDDFTENVMNVVAKTEMHEKSVFGDNGFTYAAMAIMAIILAASIIYFVDPTFFSINFSSLTGFLKQVVLSYSGIFPDFLKLHIKSDSSILTGGIIAIILLLLIFDRLLKRYRNLTSLFI